MNAFDWRSQKSFVPLIIVLGFDCIFITLNILYFYGILADPRFIIWTEGSQGGFAEIAEYIKLLFIVLCLIEIARRKSQWLYVFWSILFFYLLLDNYLQIHERVGRFFASYFHFKPFIFSRVQDIGELTVYVVFAIPLIGLVLYGQRNPQKLSTTLFELIVVYALFAVGFDMLGVIVESYWKPAGIIIGTIEDGGENTVLSVLAWYVGKTLYDLRLTTIKTVKS